MSLRYRKFDTTYQRSFQGDAFTRNDLPIVTIATDKITFPLLGAPASGVVDPHSWNLDPQSLEDAVSDRTRAIVAVHLFGLAAPMNDVLSIAHDHQLVVIEDACESIGAEYQGRRVGGVGR